MSKRINNPRKPTNFIDYLCYCFNESRKLRKGNLVSPTWALAKSWVNGQSALHVHIGIRILGEAQADDFCWLFQRKRKATAFLLKQNGIGIPRDDVSDISGKCQIVRHGSVLIHVGKLSNGPKNTRFRRDAVVWLRRLNDCPCVPLNSYPLQALALINFLSESLPSITDWELIGITRFIAIPKNKLPNQMVESRAEIVNKVTENNGEMDIEGLLGRINKHNVPDIITPYVEDTAMGLMFSPNTKLRFESAVMLFGPPEFSPNPDKLSDTSGHMLYSNHARKEDAKDTAGTRDTHTKPRGLPKEPRPSGENPQEILTASPLSEPELGTERGHHRGDYTAKHTRLGSPEDA